MAFWIGWVTTAAARPARVKAAALSIDAKVAGAFAGSGWPRRGGTGKAIGKRCVDCHQDTHQGQFSDGKTTDCARCHATEDFKTPKFDHDRDSRFRLDAQHALLECSKCHHSYNTPFGPLVRYKPLGVECGDCHKLGAVGRRKG